MAEEARVEIEELRELVQPGWDAAREQRVWAKLREDRTADVGRRRRAPWIIGLPLATATLVAAFGLRAFDGSSASEGAELLQAQSELPAREPGLIALADGSQLRATPGASYEIAAMTPALVEIQIASGALEFDVVHDPARRFRVYAGQVMVEVVGTAFSVERGASAVAIEVTRGSVRVEASTRTPVTLAAGDRLELDNRAPILTPAPSLAPEAPSLAPPEDASPPTGAPPPPTRAKARDTAWLGLADSGAHEEAWAALEDGGGGFVERDDPEALMAAADVARLTRHPKAAVAWLDVVIEDHSDSPLAPLSCFTKGRLLLERLGDPGGAAAAFARARALAPAGPLAEDALGREVEALAKAGDASQARSRAALYAERYPDGQRIRSVRRWGGLD